MSNLEKNKTNRLTYLKYIAMERIITKQDSMNTLKAVSYEKAASKLEQEAQKTEELSCNQLLKNLLMTNVKLLKLNEIRTMLLF